MPMLLPKHTALICQPSTFDEDEGEDKVKDAAAAGHQGGGRRQPGSHDGLAARAFRMPMSFQRDTMESMYE